MSVAQRRRFGVLASEAAILHAALMQAGLLKTGQLMHGVVQQIGFEIAEQIVPSTPETLK